MATPESPSPPEPHERATGRLWDTLGPRAPLYVAALQVAKHWLPSGLKTLTTQTLGPLGPLALGLTTYQPATQQVRAQTQERQRAQEYLKFVDKQIMEMGQEFPSLQITLLEAPKLNQPVLLFIPESELHVTGDEARDEQEQKVYKALFDHIAEKGNSRLVLTEDQALPVVTAYTEEGQVKSWIAKAGREENEKEREALIAKVMEKISGWDKRANSAKLTTQQQTFWALFLQVRLPELISMRPELKLHENPVIKELEKKIEKDIRLRDDWLQERLGATGIGLADGTLVTAALERFVQARRMKEGAKRLESHTEKLRRNKPATIRPFDDTTYDLKRRAANVLNKTEAELKRLLKRRRNESEAAFAKRVAAYKAPLNAARFAQERMQAQQHRYKAVHDRWRGMRPGTAKDNVEKQLEKLLPGLFVVASYGEDVDVAVLQEMCRQMGIGFATVVQDTTPLDRMPSKP